MAFRLAAEGLQDLLVGFFERVRRQNLLQPGRSAARRDSAAPGEPGAPDWTGRRPGTRKRRREGKETQSPHGLVAAKRRISILDHVSQDGAIDFARFGAGWR